MGSARRDEFVDYLRDQLGGLGDVRSRRMFGSHGLYYRDVFFGIANDGRLYLKTDETTAPTYEALGMGPFQPTPKVTLARYRGVPADIIEDAEHLEEWVRVAVAVAVAVAAADLTSDPADAGRPRPRRRRG